MKSFNDAQPNILEASVAKLGKRTRDETELREYSNENYNGKSYKTTYCKVLGEGLIEKHCKCWEDRNRSGCSAQLKVFKRHGERTCVESGRHICTVEKPASLTPTGRVPTDTRPLWQMGANPPGLTITHEIKDEIWRKLGICQEQGALVPLTGSSRERFYVPDFYGPRVAPSLISLREYLDNLFLPIQSELYYRYPHVRHFRIGLILSYPGARAQAKVHYDYSPALRRLEPEFRAISCLMAIDGFSFTYLGDNDIWQRLGCPENTWITFIDGCLHFESANSLPRPALRAFYYGVANEEDFPQNFVFFSEDGFPDPDILTIGCEQDQDPNYTRPPRHTHAHTPSRTPTRTSTRTSTRSSTRYSTRARRK